MKPVEAFLLRMSLANAGFIPVPCRAGVPAVIPGTAPSEAGIRSWATLHERATETGIVVDDHLVVVADLEEARAAIASRPTRAFVTRPAPATRIKPPPTARQAGSGLRAREFLHDHLSHGPKSSRAVIEAAQAQGISLITLRRAKRELGVLAEPVKSNGYKVELVGVEVARPDVR